MDTVIWILVIVAAAAAGYQFVRASQEESKEARTVKSLPPSVQHVVAQMDGGTQAAFFNEYDRKKKRKSIGYLAWFFLAWHYLYARKVGMQFAFWFTLGGFGLWWFVDLFRMPSIIRSVNEQMAREALQTLHIGAAFASMPAAATLLTHSVPTPSAAPTVAPAAASGVLITAGATTVPGSRAAEFDRTVVVPGTSGGGWHADPTGRHRQRYWDGAAWTAHVVDDGAAGHDPL